MCDFRVRFTHFDIGTYHIYTYLMPKRHLPGVVGTYYTYDNIIILVSLAGIVETFERQEGDIRYLHYT